MNRYQTVTQPRTGEMWPGTYGAYSQATMRYSHIPTKRLRIKPLTETNDGDDVEKHKHQ